MQSAHATPLSAANYWRFSVSAYALPGIQPVLLTAQDTQKLDINLLLLLAYLQVNGFQPSDSHMKSLLTLSENWQKLHLRPFRAKRQKAKEAEDKSIYSAFKKAELNLEKAAQRALFQCAVSKSLARALSPAAETSALTAYGRTHMVPDSLMQKLIQ